MMKDNVFGGTLLLLVLSLVSARSGTSAPRPSDTRQTQAATDVKTAIQQAEELLRIWREKGKNEESRTKLLAHLARCDAVFGKNAEYLLAKSDCLSALGEYEKSREVFESVPDEALTTPRHLFNRINFTYAKRPEAAVVLLRRLAADDSPRARSSLVDWVHNSLAQAFAPVRKPWVGPTLDPLLDGLCQSDQPRLCAVTSGFRVWARAQAVEHDATQLAALLDAPMGGYGSYVHRYRLLLAGLAERNPQTHERGWVMRDRVIADLLATTETEDGTVPDERYSRAVKRYWLAYAHYAQAIAAFGKGDDAGGMRLLRSAAEWSPDGRDVQSGGFFYERVTLGGRPEYRTPLAERLERTGNLEEALALRASAARLDADLLPALRRVHAVARPREPFERYWAEQRLDGAPVAPDFSLPSVTGRTLTLSSLRGEWILIDFWGTWCQPCVEDVPMTEQLYRRLQTTPIKAKLLTVAVQDTVEQVRSFMNARHLTFPVLMGDEETVKRFNVPHYPYRILVSPDGRYLELANGRDWASQAERILMPPKAP